MDNTLYVALSRQMILAREMDVIANNISNADTPGFKVEQIMSQTNPKPLADGSVPGSPNLNFVLDVGVARDFSQGALSQTGRPLDVGIEGDGFFKIAAARGERFTRDGRFTMDSKGVLVTASGEPVSGDGGPITLDPSKGEPTIASDGAISQGGVRVGKLSVYRFAAMSALEKDGDGLYRNAGNQSPEAAPDVRLSQGSVESSNVKPVIEITRMIEVSREYERIAKLMDQTSQLNAEAIQRLGKVN